MPKMMSVETLSTTILESCISAKEPTPYAVAVLNITEPMLCNLILTNEDTSFKTFII